MKTVFAMGSPKGGKDAPDIEAPAQHVPFHVAPWQPGTYGTYVLRCLSALTSTLVSVLSNALDLRRSAY